MYVEEIDSLYPQPLAAAYLGDFSGVDRLFKYNPGEKGDFHARFHYLMNRQKENRSLAGSLKEYNLSLGCGEETTRNIDLLENNGALTVITGQQPGLCTGPLYTIYKAIGTIQLARELGRELNHPVVPVFWIGADDHDFEEVNHIYLPTSQGPQKVSLREKPDGRFSIGHLPLPGEAGTLFTQMRELTPPIGWQQEGLELLRQTALASENWADWFGRLMTFLFRDYGLVLVNPLLKPLRILSANVFHQAVTTAPRVEELLEQTSLEVQRLGFSPQVQSEEGKAHIFMYVNDRRQPLYFNNGQFRNREGSMTWDRNWLAERTLTHPEAFSPDVILRPVVQEVLFPVLAYVGGPGEIGYFAQLKSVFEHFGEEMPVVYPRPNITLMEPLVAKRMRKYNIPLSEIPLGLDSFSSNYLEQSDKAGIEARFDEFREALVEQHKRLVKGVAIIDPEIKLLGEEFLRRLIRNQKSFESKVNQRHRKNNEVALRQLSKINQAIHPLGQWQERVYNIFPYLMKYRPEMLKTMVPLINVYSWKQKIIFFN